jgi:hypothetical protein
MEQIEAARHPTPGVAPTETAAATGEKGRPGGRTDSTPRETRAARWWAAYLGAAASNR